jgi:HSP20 family protein
MTKENAMAEVREAPKPRTHDGSGQAKEIAPRTTAAPMKSSVHPFAYMRRLAEEMDQLFEHFGLQSGFRWPRFLSRGHELLRREAGLVPGDWSPKIEVLEREGQLVIRADLPGLSKEDIKVEVTNDLLTIQGERKQEKKEEREGHCYSECSYGSFYRAIPLPEGADASKATADFRKGVLEVTVPAPPSPEPKARRLEVREGK